MLGGDQHGHRDCDGGEQRHVVDRKGNLRITNHVEKKKLIKKTVSMDTGSWIDTAWHHVVDAQGNLWRKNYNNINYKQ